MAPRQNGAAGGLPVEGGRARHQTLYVVLVQRHGAFEYLGGDAQRGQLADDGGKELLADFRADVAVFDQIDRSLRVRAVGRRALLEITEDLVERIAAPRGHAEHHREEVPLPARGDHFALRTVLAVAAEARAGSAVLLGIGRRI